MFRPGGRWEVSVSLTREIGDGKKGGDEEISSCGGGGDKKKDCITHEQGSGNGGGVTLGMGSNPGKETSVLHQDGRGRKKEKDLSPNGEET